MLKMKMTCHYFWCHCTLIKCYAMGLHIVQVLFGEQLQSFLSDFLIDRYWMIGCFPLYPDQVAMHLSEKSVSSFCNMAKILIMTHITYSMWPDVGVRWLVGKCGNLRFIVMIFRHSSVQKYVIVSTNCIQLCLILQSPLKMFKTLYHLWMEKFRPKIEKCQQIEVVLTIKSAHIAARAALGKQLFRNNVAISDLYVN